jgi:DNA-binding transcriptional LysR family regulator
MELRRVKHFLAVVDQGSFTAAAQKLGVSQQAVSKSINVLEDELGVRLFERDTRLVTLSRFGELLLSHARNIDAEAQQFKRHLEDAVGVRSGRLVIGAGLTATTYILPLVLRRLVAKRPNLKISVRDGSAPTLIPMLLRGELDVTLCVLGKPLDDSLVREELLFQERLRVIVGAGHPLAGAKNVELAALLDYPWFVGWLPALDHGVSSTFTEHGLKPPVPKLDTTSLPLARALLAAGEYISVLPEHLFLTELEEGTLAVVEIAPDIQGWSRPMSLCYRRNSVRSPATMALVNELTLLLRERPNITGLSMP